MNIKVRINKIISCILVTVMVLSCMGNAAPALANGLATLAANDVPTVYADEGEALYTQDFTGVTDVSAVGATSLSSSDGLSIASDDSHSDYLEFDISKSSSNGGGRGARVRLGSYDVSALNEYIVEFDAVIKASTGAGSTFTVTGTDFRYSNGGGDSHMNTGVGSGYLLSLSSATANSTTYTIAGSGNVTIPSGEWCHYKLYVDKTSGNVSVTITDADGEYIVDKSIVAYNGGGNFEGFYALVGKANGATMYDNIVVREVTSDDEFGAVEEVTVSFELNGHGEAIDDVTIIKGGLVEVFAAPLAEGYVFRGWFTDEDLTEEFNLSTDAVTDNITLYAKWTTDTAEDGSDALYYQSFSGISDISTVVKSTNNQGGVVLATDDTHGYYLSYSMSGVAANRGAYMDFTATTQNTYVVEFDAAISPAETNKTEFVIKGSDYADTGVNSGGATGYILSLVNAAGGSTVYTVNGTETTVTIPSGEWCHYKLSVDKTAKTVTVTITGNTTANIANEVTVAYDSADGSIAGMYMLIGRATGSYLLDNVKVYDQATDGDSATVSFDMNGHGGQIDAVEVNVGETVDEPTAPTADGYTFGGWYTEEGCTNEYNFETAVEEDITLYAKWTANEPSGDGGEEEVTALYKQDFTGVTDASTVAVSPNAQAWMTIKTDDTHGDYLSYATESQNSRGANVDFTGLDVSGLDSYIVEFKAALTTGNGQDSYFTIKGTDHSYVGGSSKVNDGTASGYLLTMLAGANTTTWTANGSKALTIPSGEWCSYKLYVDKTQGKVSLTIADASGNLIADKAILSYNGAGNVAGIYMRTGRYYPVQLIDDIVVREVAATDEFGTISEVTVSFDLNGHGTTETPAAQTVVAGSIATAPAWPVEAGYAFIGWYKEAGCTNAFNIATDPITENMTLYAKWIVDPTVTVDHPLYTQFFNGTTPASEVVTPPSSAGMDYSILTDDVHGYYLRLFGGGDGDRNMTVNFTGIADLSSKLNYIVEFDASIVPGTVNPGNQLIVKGSDWDSSASTGYILKLKNSAASGTTYTVNDSDTTVTIPSNTWYHYKLEVNKVTGKVTVTITDGEGATIGSAEVAYNGGGNVSGLYIYSARKAGSALLDNIVVHEIINETEATVSFDMNDVGTQISPVVVTKGETYTAPTPEASGYTFSGWYTDEALTTPYDATVAVTGNFTLYAKWTEVVAGTQYSLVKEATGNTTAVDCAVLVYNENVSGYRVTTVDANGNIVKQYESVAQPTSVDTTGATKLEITPIFYYAIGAAGQKGTASYPISLPAGTYDFTVYNTSGKRCDVYANDQMLVNNILQYGSTPNNFTSKDIVITGSTIAISTDDHDDYTANDMNIQVKVVAAPSIANRTQKIYVLGDSLVAMYYNGGSKTNNLAQTGWGQVLADYLVDTVDVVDLGNSGVTANGLYTTAFSQVVGSGQSGDILILESGYNDRTYDTEDVMKTALRNMISEAEAVGVTVILVSPNASAHTYGDTIAWTNRMEAVVEETGVDYIDLCELSYNFFESLYAGDKTVMEAVWNVSDRLHSTYNAANKFAAIIAGELYSSLGYSSLVDTSHVYTFIDTVGNVISCSATGATDSNVAKVTYNLNGQGNTTYVLADKGTKLTAPEVPSVFGYSFEGWFTDSACTDEWDFDADTVSADTVLYAKWVENNVWYSQDFTNVTDASTVATSTNAQDQLKIANDATHGNYLTFDFTGVTPNSRGAYMNFGTLDLTDAKQYIVEFEASIKPGTEQSSGRNDQQETYFTLKGADFTYNSSNINNGANTGWIMNLMNSKTATTTYSVNGTQTAEIPSGEWCKYKIYVDKEQELVSITITNASGTAIMDKVVTSYNGAGNAAGFYMLAGRYYAVLAVDNIIVRDIENSDEFGEIQEEVLTEVTFTSELNQVITQPAEGSYVNLPIAIKATGDLGGDLTDKVSVTWSLLGLEEEDGYISLTKAAGTGAGTTGDAPDGATAYFNVRNGVSNYYGAVKAVVTYNDVEFTLYTPFAVLGSSSADANQLAPAGGYPVSMDEYADSMVGYVGNSNTINSKEVALNNWSIYGSNSAKTLKLVEVDGKKALEFASNGGGGTTVAVYQWTDQTSQYVIDFTAMFTSDMGFGVYFNTPNNAPNNPEWTVSYADSTVTFGDKTITGVNANEWYRFVIAADPSTQVASLKVYNAAGTLVGEIKDIAMTNNDSVQKYFCFMGTWPMYLNSFQAYKPSVSDITITATTDTVAVPEAGAADATVDLTAALASKDGLVLTGTVNWSLADEYANVELASTGAQTATLTVKNGAAGKVIVVASKDGVTEEYEITLTTTSDVVSFTKSTSSITIPFAGEDAVTCDFAAVTLSSEGEVIDGGTITYTLLAKDGETAAGAINGVTFNNGVLTVAAGATPAVVYVKATNENGLSSKIKVNIHGFSFAFGSDDPATGYTHVTADTVYTEKLGFGFMSIDGLTANSANVTGTADYRFKVTVPNGNYTVVLTTSASSVTSEVVESVSAVTGITRTSKTFDVAVCDGVLDITFPADSTVSNVVITKKEAKTALEKPMIYAIGDSTTKNKVSESGQISWGNVVAEGTVLLPNTFSGFANHGKAGDDSVVYYNAARVEAVLLAICPGDYVTVNMGINSKTTGEAAAYYTLLSEYYVEGILQRGGIPVIVTATPDGPVGDRVSTNYNSTTGKFTNSRGDGARNDVLRQIAAEKELNIIELGQWGEDWMNTLTTADVTAYNTANGTSYTTVLEMVQSWYADHNHYREYLAVKIAEYLLDELKDLEVEKESIIFDFQNETSPNWEMTGDLSSAISIVDDSAVAGNKYLKFYKKEARTTTTTRIFADMPKMTEAEVAFRWYFGEQTSTSRAGFTGIKFMAGETELLALYFGELRADGDTTSIYYSTAGLDAKVDSGVKVSKGSWYDVSIDFDFANDKATVYVGGAKVAADIAIEAVAQNVDALAFVTFDPNGGTKVTSDFAIDDLSISYVEKTAEDDVITIYSLGTIDNVTVTDTEWKAGYTHPTSVTATLTNGDTITVEINADTWVCVDFDEKTKGAYTWTAEIIAPAEYANTKGLEATYIMEYSTSASSSKYDYYNDFTFESDMIPSVAWGKSMDSSSGSGYFTLTHTFVNGNGYLLADVTGNGDRGSRLDLNGGIVKGATFTFDWMPANNNGSANGQIMFVSTASWHPYFTLRFDSDYNITAFTENPLGLCSTTQEAFEGSIGADDPIDTGLGGQNTWFTVSVTFDYLAHTADLTITDKANPSNTFTKNNIPIEAAANGTRAMVIHMNKLASGANVAMGLDNIAIDYDKFDGGDVVKVTNPADVAVAKTEYADFTFPTTVKVGLGDGSSVNLLVKKWTATPAFNKEVSAEYVWTADLVLRDYSNHFDLKPSFTMTYTMLPYPTYVYSPTTLELEYGEELPSEFPTTVIAHMSNGEIGTVEVGEWTPIREFNANEEGIYVYGANIVAKEGVYDVVESRLSVNENPEDPSAQREDYVYDVYYRISYFESEDNYNAYARSMEYLDRGVYAVKGKGGIFVSWRLLVHEYGEDVAFNIYRNGELVNSTPITDKTNYIDAAGKAGDVYTVGKIQDGKLYESEEVVATSNNYLTIPMQKPEPQPDKNGTLSTYSINDAGTADVDGDGQYEIIIKWYPSDAFDSGSAVEPSAPTIFDVYEMDGTPLWRLNLGLEMPSGAHFNPFMLYDLDEDGKAELFVKTSDGSVTYKPNADGKFDMTDESTIVSYIGDKNVVPGTNINQNGHAASSSNEYVTVFNGMTGEEIDTINFVNVTGDYADWGKDGDGGNRSARYNIAIAYLPEDQNNANCTDTIPAVLFNRGYYNKTTVAAYTLRDGKISLEWNFVTESGTEYAGKGNHNMSTGDVDKDGFDELVIGAMAIDHDGSVLWVKNGVDGQDYAGHADAIHLAAMNPNKNDLYVFTPQEEQISTLNYSLVNAGTGTRWLASWFTKKDVGRGVAANITPLPGYESWAAASGSGLYAFDGSLISTAKNVPMNWVLYWDGDLLSELGDGASTEGNMVISKYNWNTDSLDTLAKLSGTKMCNSTKNTPSLTADLFGDWREEVVLRNSDDTELRIYMTTIKTDYMIYTLMHDPVYRNSVANQNTSYNQPSHVGIYLGEDQRDVVLNMQLDTANVVYTVDEVGEEIKEAIDNATADDIIESVENAGIDEVADAMQNDTEVLDKMSEIENEFVENNGIEVLAPVVEHKDMETSDIKEAVGVGLNAQQNNSEIGLVFEKTAKENEKPVNEEVYSKSVQIDISLVCDGELIEGKLKTPVTITMKLPKGLNGNGIWIFHYHGDDMDVIRPAINMDGTITFSVTSFSTFVFANKSSAQKETSDSDDNYYVDSDANNRAYAERNWNGQEGWQKLNGEWYYFDANGKLVIGWVLDKDGKWYYMNNDGKMATKWVLSPESKLWYYMDPTNGHMISGGWLCDPDSSRWYYLDPNGAMCTSWIFVDGAWYLLDKNGAMCTGWNLVNNQWYLLGSNGAMLTGWQEVGGKQYYLLPSGECLMNTTTPDGHKVNAKGEKED